MTVDPTNVEPTSMWKYLTALGAFGSIGSIITGTLAYLNSREVVTAVRDDNLYNKYNKLFGPILFETPDYYYIYLTFALINERKKVLIKDIKCSIFDPYEQKRIPCDILSCPPPDQDDFKVNTEFAPGPFPKGYHNLGATNSREIQAASARDYFLGLRCNGFKIVNLEDKTLTDPNEEFMENLSFDLRIEITSSRGKYIMFETCIWTRDPKKLNKDTLVTI